MTTKEQIAADYADYTPPNLIRVMVTSKAQMSYHIMGDNCSTDYLMELLDEYEVLKDLAGRTELGRRLLNALDMI